MELKKYLQDETVGHVGYRGLVSVGLDSTVGQAIKAMQAEKVGCVLVVNGNRVRGIFTERDMLKRVLLSNQSLDTPVSAVMTPEPVVAEEDEPIYSVLSKMHLGGRRHLPVLSASGEPLGTISVKRVARFIADHFAPAVYNLPPEPDSYGDSREGA